MVSMFGSITVVRFTEESVDALINSREVEVAYNEGVHY